MTADLFAEIIVDRFIDDENDAPETCPVCVEERVIDDAFAVLPKGGELFYTAETAADAGGHDDQDWVITHWTHPFSFRTLPLYHSRNAF